ncbi:unnamed protein product [Urochloa humidicola]
MALDVGSLLSVAPVPALDAGASSAPRPWSRNSAAGAAAAVSVDASTALFGGDDDMRLKRELVAWVKAVASMARESAQQLPC